MKYLLEYRLISAEAKIIGQAADSGHTCVIDSHFQNYRLHVKFFVPNVSLSIINTNFSAQAGLSAHRDGLFMESASSPYVNALVSREDNKDSDKIQKLKSALQSPEVAAKAEEVYKGDAIKGW